MCTSQNMINDDGVEHDDDDNNNNNNNNNNTFNIIKRPYWQEPFKGTLQ